MERLTIMETQIKGFKWAVSVIIIVCAAWGWEVYAQANKEGNQFAVLQSVVSTNAKEIARSNIWLKETTDKANKIDGIEKDITYLIKGLDSIETLLRLVHNVHE